MAWSISERFPSWGETGEFPAAGFFYEGGDQVNEKHMDALWNGINGLEEDVQAALNDLDSNADGVVDKAEAGAAGFDLNGDLLAAGGEVVWDESAGYIPQGRLENDTIGVSAGDGLKGGGTPQLGGSTTLNIEPADFAGTGLADDGKDNLYIPQGSGSGLNADFLDGQDASEIKRTDEQILDTVGGSLGYGLQYDDGANSISSIPRGPNPWDAARTFAESNLTLTFNGTRIANKSVSLVEESTVSGYFNAAGTTDVDNNLSGVTFTVDQSFDSLTIDFYSDYSGTLKLENLTDGVTVASTSVNASQYTLTGLGLEAGKKYAVGLDGGDAAFYVEESPNPDLPADSPALTVTDGYLGGVTSAAYAVKSLTANIAATSGNVAIEWPNDDDIYEWDVATFTRTLDGETVTLDVEYSTDGGSTWQTHASDISRDYDISGIPADANVRFYASLSRNNLSNNPTLDSVARSYFL